MAERNFLTFCSPKIEPEDIAEAVDCLKSQWLSTGPRVEKFEALFGCFACGQRRSAFPAAEYLSDRTNSLPLSAKLTDNDTARTISAVQKSLEAAPSGRKSFALGGF